MTTGPDVRRTVAGPGASPHDGRAAVPSGVAARLRAARAPLVLGGAVAAASLALVLRDPHAGGSWGVCPLLALTGWYCPACGALRATHDLLVGDVAGAWAMNPLWVVLAPVVVLLWARWLGERLGLLPVRAGRTGGDATAAPVLWPVVAAVVLVAYGVARNVPALAPWLAP